MFSQTLLIGRLGKEPEFITTKNGCSLCKISVATTGKWLDENNVTQEKVSWHQVIVWGKLAELCRDNLTKGKIVFIEGEIENSSWEDENKVKHYKSEVKARKVLFFDSYNFTNK